MSAFQTAQEFEAEYSMTVHDVALAMGVTDITVRRWIAADKLPARQRRGSRIYRIKPADVEAMLLEDQPNAEPQPDPNDGRMENASAASRFVLPKK
jgi:excisionase family DNA binding protein